MPAVARFRTNQLRMVNMASFTSVTGCRTPLLECSVIAHIKTVSADTNKLFCPGRKQSGAPGEHLLYRRNCHVNTIGPASCRLNALTPSLL